MPLSRLRGTDSASQSESSEDEEGVSFWKSRRNPFSRNGALARAAERVPGLNNAMQGLHHAARDKRALERARQHNPLRASGYVTRGVERVPILNNVVQEMHKACGNTADYERAREKNPLGKSGYVTKIGEHIPGLADTIRCIHQYRGNEMEAERARVYSLQKMVGRKGAITKLAELLPGTHLIAAAMCELKGDREEAMKALNILRNWKDIGSADGALARIAEMVPGLDVIQFGLMVNAGHFAHAIRAICKTKWVEIKAKSTGLIIGTAELQDLVVLTAESDLEYEPKVASLAAGMVDVGMHLLDFDGHGDRRWTSRRERHAKKGDVVKHHGLKGAVQDVKINKANEALKGMLELFFDNAHQLVEVAVDLTNWAVFDWSPASSTNTIIMWSLYVMFPPMTYEPPPSDAPSAIFAQAVQDSFPEVTVAHKPMPLNPAKFFIPPRKEKAAGKARHLPEAAAAISCLSFVGCLGCGMHTGTLAVVAGCTAGLAAAHRKVKANLITWMNQVNSGVWEWMSAPVVPTRGPPPERCRSPDSGRFGKASSSSSNLHPASASSEPYGIVFDWSQETIEQLQGAEKLRDYFLEEFLIPTRLLNWVHPAVWMLQLFELHLRNFLNDALDGQAVPLVIPIPMPEGEYGGGSIWLPEIRVMLILWFRFTDHRYVTKVTVGVVDGMIDQIANVVKEQLLPADLRTADPRLEEFTEPIDLQFDIALKWLLEDKLRIELNDFHVKLCLPK